VNYKEYIKELSKNPTAKKVKIADLLHNSDETRLEKITVKDIARREKYKKALEFLQNWKIKLISGKIEIFWKNE